MLGAIDIERGAKVSGSRFYFLTGVGAELEFALVNMAMDQARDAGFTQMIAAVAGQAAGDGGHRLPRPGRRRRLPDRGRRTSTSSAPRRCRWRRTTPTRSSTPARCRCATPRSARASARRPARTARTPAASSGCTGSTRSRCSSTRPLEESYAEHQRLLEWEKEFLDKLELAYRVIDVAAGDLGLSAQRKFDCEAWIPTQGRYRELTSTSNCTDFQARRLDIRGRFADGDDRAGRHPQRHAVRDHRARSSRSSRPTSRPTARCACPRRCGPTCRGARSSKPVHDGDLEDGWQPRLVALDIDGTLLKWVEGAGTTYEQITPAGVRRRAPRARRRRARRARQRPVAARHDRRSPTCSTCTRDGGEPALGGGQQRRGGLPLPAARGRPRGDLRRRARPSRRCSSTTRRRWSRSRSAASATASTGPSPTASSPAR